MQLENRGKIVSNNPCFKPAHHTAADRFAVIERLTDRQAQIYATVCGLDALHANATADRIRDMSGIGDCISILAELHDTGVLDQWSAVE
jgi:hypothetical protein